MSILGIYVRFLGCNHEKTCVEFFTQATKKGEIFYEGFGLLKWSKNLVNWYFVLAWLASKKMYSSGNLLVGTMVLHPPPKKN